MEDIIPMKDNSIIRQKTENSKQKNGENAHFFRENDEKTEKIGEKTHFFDKKPRGSEIPINANDRVNLPSPPFKFGEIELRPYQIECLESIENSTERSKVIVIPTGGGKTITFVAHALRHNLKTLVIAHRREIIQQTKETVLKLDPTCSVGIVMGKQNETDQQITIASIQTLYQQDRLRQLPTDYDLIICDEAHHATANSYRRLFYRYGLIDLDTCGIKNAEGLLPYINENRELLGATATPERTDKETLDAIFDEIVYRISIADLIPEYLSDLRCITLDVGVDISHVSSTAGDLSESQLGNALSDSGLLEDLPNVVNGTLDKRQHILIFLPNVASAIEATEILNNAGIPSRCVHGKTPNDQRQQTLRDFQSGKLRVLVNCMVLTEGFDCPCIDALIVARPTQSGLLIQQMVGRGLRISPGKNDCLILDLAFKRRQQDLISVAASGIFGGYQDLQFTRKDLSLLELIKFQKERAPLLQDLHSVLTQRIAKLKTENTPTEKQKETINQVHSEPLPTVPANMISEGILLLVDTVLLRRFCGEATNLDNVWTRLTQALARTSPHMRKLPATEKQKSFLASKLPFDTQELELLNKADAWALIGTLIEFEPPTQKQLNLLQHLGVPQDSMPSTKAKVRDMIDQLLSRRKHHD